MKEFVVGSAFLMFISSLPIASVSNGHTVSLEPQLTVQNAAFLQSFGNSLPPIGYVTFCKDHEAECKPSGPIVDRMQLTARKRNELERVNRYVNQSVKPVTDLDLYGKVEVWAYPTAGKGDCEDYVLLKRRMLIERGWPESTLLITVVRDENGEGHAVLTARTDVGDLVLDNKRQEIVRWTDTPYTFVKQQSEENPLVWASLMPPSGDASQTTASHGR
jgi:predicted transglutaminase-like cysteine proteinase